MRGALIILGLAMASCGASVQRASLNVAPMVVRAPENPKTREPLAIRVDQSRFIVTASDSVTGSHKLHFERWSGAYTDGMPARMTVDLEAPSIVAESSWVTDVVRSDLLETHRFPTIHIDVNLEAGITPDVRVVTGNVTLHGITRAIRFDAKVEGPPERIHLTAVFDMSRSAFDIHRHDRFDSVIDDDFRIRLDFVAEP